MRLCLQQNIRRCVPLGSPLHTYNRQNKQAALYSLRTIVKSLAHQGPYSQFITFRDPSAWHNTWHSASMVWWTFCVLVWSSVSAESEQLRMWPQNGLCIWTHSFMLSPVASKYKTRAHKGAKAFIHHYYRGQFACTWQNQAVPLLQRFCRKTPNCQCTQRKSLWKEF